MDGLDAMIIGLYPHKVTVCQIRRHLESPSLWSCPQGRSPISPIAAADAVMEWQHRPLEEFHPVICLDAIRVEVRHDSRVTSRAAHIAVGVDMDGVEHVLGIWVQADEGPSFWAHACAEFANRDVLIVCCDGLTGPPEANRGDLARLDGPDLRGAADPGLDAVRVLRGPQEGRRRPQAGLHRRQRGRRTSGVERLRGWSAEQRKSRGRLVQG